MSVATSKVKAIVIPALERTAINVTIKGTTPLICHRYSERVQHEMEEKQQGAAKVKKAPRDPQREFIESLYSHPEGGYGFPATAIKQAMISAGQRFAGEVGTRLKGAITIPTDMLRIESPAEPTMRTDRVVLGGMSRTTSLAYRPQFAVWSMQVPIVFNSGVVTLDQVVNLVSLAGFSVGIGDWRIEKDGSFGQFEVANVEEYQRA